jgi:hypothetical protein
MLHCNAQANGGRCSAGANDRLCKRTTASIPSSAPLGAGGEMDAFFFFTRIQESTMQRNPLPTATKFSRRSVIQAAAGTALGLSPALRATAWAAGSDAPEKKEVKIGFIPLTDCASVVMASACWASTRSTA